MTKNSSLRDSILASTDIEYEPIEIPEWDFKGYIRELDGFSRFVLSEIASGQSRERNNFVLEGYVCEGLVDENKVRVFSIDDREALSHKNPDVVMRIYRRVLKLSKMDSLSAEEVEGK